MAWGKKLFWVLLVPDLVQFLEPSSDTAGYRGPGWHGAWPLFSALWSNAKQLPYLAVMQPVKILSMVQL